MSTVARHRKCNPITTFNFFNFFLVFFSFLFIYAQKISIYRSATSAFIPIDLMQVHKISSHLSLLQVQEISYHLSLSSHMHL
jgi:hypothetical protein